VERSEREWKSGKEWKGMKESEKECYLCLRSGKEWERAGRSWSLRFTHEKNRA